MSRWHLGRWRRPAGALFAALAMGPLAGCGTLDYYWQSAAGHLVLMRAARPVQDALDDPATPQALRRQLALSQRIRQFAVTELHLPDGPSYRRYADLKRRAVVWNVVAAPPYSLQAKTWCFPIAGCVGYRGYFDEADARRFADELGQSGEWETDVHGVPAYSTLGWSNWLGGDPLLSTFIHYPEGELARLIFHEMAHQVVYVQDDTAFNESFATAVERLGVTRWLLTQASPGAREQYEAGQRQRQAFQTLTRAMRERLRQVYEKNTDTALADIQKLAIKKEAYDQFRQSYDDTKRQLGGTPQQWAGYDAWVAKANNASFAALAAYDDAVPAFEALFERVGQSWPAFYDEVKRLAQLPAAQRKARLAGWLTTPAAAPQPASPAPGPAAAPR